MGYIHQELFHGYAIGDFSPVRIMGVVNLSPESFYQGSFIPTDGLRDTINNFIQTGQSSINLGSTEYPLIFGIDRFFSYPLILNCL